jgi:phage-related protein
MARHEDTIYVLHCFTKDTARTEKNDLTTAESRWKAVQRRLREEKKDEKKNRS